MKRRLAWLVLWLVLAAALGWAVLQSPGYLLVSYSGFRFESSLWAGLALIAVLCLAFYLLRLSITTLLVAGGLANPWSGRHRNRRARKAAEIGFVDLLEGRWERARMHLQRAAAVAEQPLIYFLGAARAAQKLGEYEECDVLLERALDAQPKAELAVALTHAELQEARGDSAGALETLQVMQQRYPRHLQVLRQLQALLQRRGDWSALLALLPELHKSKALASKELTALELEVWRQRLLQAGQAEVGSLQTLNEAWKQLSAAQRQDVELLLAYAEQLVRLGAPVDAEAVLRKAIKHQFDSRMVRVYGVLHGGDGLQQLQTAEAWLSQHPQDAQLLLCLGRLSLKAALWGKARDYFEASLGVERSAETCAELARLLARLGEVERSNELLHEGFALLDQQLPALPLP